MENAHDAVFVPPVQGSVTHGGGAHDAAPSASEVSTKPVAAPVVNLSAPIVAAAMATLPPASTSRRRVLRAKGVGVKGWRGTSLIKLPLPAGERMSHSIQRGSL